MVNFLYTNKFNNILLSYTLVAFTISLLPHPVYAVQNEINLNDVGFAFRVEKLIEKVNRYREKNDSNRLLETMLDLKVEVEGYTGQKINLDKQLDQVEKDIKANGGKLKKDEMKNFRKIIKKKEERSNHKALYLATCMEYDLPYNAEEENFMFITKYGHDKNNDDQEICVPLHVTIGVTVALCGLFLYFVPVPLCKVWAPELMKAGVALAVEGTIKRVEDNDKNKDKK